MKKQNNKIEPFKLPFPKYKEGEINSVVIVLKDISTIEETENGEKTVVEKPKTQAEADEFLIMLNGLSKTSGFEIDAAGTREQMASRLYKKDGSELITQEDALEFCKQYFAGNSNIKEPSLIPTIEDLHDFLILKY